MCSSGESNPDPRKVSKTHLSTLCHCYKDKKLCSKLAQLHASFSETCIQHFQTFTAFRDIYVYSISSEALRSFPVCLTFSSPPFYNRFVIFFLDPSKMTWYFFYMYDAQSKSSKEDWQTTYVPFTHLSTQLSRFWRTSKYVRISCKMTKWLAGRFRNI